MSGWRPPWRPALALAGLLGCSEPPPPPEPVDFVYRVVRDADGERFIGEPGAPALRWEGRRVVGPERSVKAIQRWTKLGELLNACIGDPLALPPAGDPGAFRKLVWSEEPYWRVDLSGMNRCSLEGWIELELRRNSVPRADLRVDGLPLREGGAEKAREILDAALRAEATRLWPTLDLEAQLLVLKRLSEMPEGKTPLEALLAESDAPQPPIELALRRWQERFEPASD